MTIRAKLYAAIVLAVLGPLVTIAVALQGARRSSVTASTRCVSAVGHECARPRAEVRRYRRERLADRLRLRRRAPRGRASSALWPISASTPCRRCVVLREPSVSDSCSLQLDDEFGRFMERRRRSPTASFATAATRPSVAPLPRPRDSELRGDGDHERAPRSLRGPRAGDGFRARLRRHARRRPQAVDRGRPGRGPRDRVAAP